MSTEHDFSPSSPQYAFIKNDLAGVDRTRTPWLIFLGHRSVHILSPPFGISFPSFSFRVSPETQLPLFAVYFCFALCINNFLYVVLSARQPDVHRQRFRWCFGKRSGAPPSLFLFLFSFSTHTRTHIHLQQQNSTTHHMHTLTPSKTHRRST